MLIFHKKLRIFLLSAIAYLLFISYAKAQPAIELIENKNQWHPNVLYKANLLAGALFLENNCFTYNLVQVDDIKHSHAHHDHQHTEIPKIIHFHAYKVNFANVNKDVKIHPSEHASDYCNYFIGKDPARWASYVKKYKVVEYRNIYENIDMKVYSRGFNLKYDFIVYPGAEVENIVLYYEGIDNMLIRKGNLIIETSVNEITELKPFAYQVIDGDTIEILCNYKLKGNNISFSFPSDYDHSKQLIIDPVLIFATYSGSTTDNWGFTATYDNEGNVYSGGIAFYEAGFSYPVSLGAYQEDFGGPNILWGNDVAIIKYNPTGTDRLFATYLGGNSSEMPHSLVVNEYNELIILGTTGSVDFPVTSNAYDTTFNYGTSVSYDNVIDFNNGTDIYIARLSPDGSQLLASTYIGGTANDGLNFRDSYNSFIMHGNGALYYNYADGARGEIIVDGKNCVYVGTCTFSTDFPVSGSAFQTTNSGNQEGVVFKLDINLSMLMWSSYIGGSNDDAIYSIDNDETYQVYIAGGTSSTDFPTTAGAYQTNYHFRTVDPKAFRGGRRRSARWWYL